jgi:bacterioferritin
MKGNDNVIATLNALLAEELTAINQYMVHSEMCANWGYGKLHDHAEKRAITEMRHAEKLIERVLFLEGQPIVSQLNALHIGSDVVAQFRSDLDAEITAVKEYNDAIRQAGELSDNGTRKMLEGILSDEEDHVDWLEAQLDQVAQMGLSQYLVEQVS